MNKKELARKLARKTFLTQKESIEVIEEMLGIISKEVMEGEEVSLVGFGKFYPYEHAPRPVRNPKTQEEMILSPYKTLKFKLSPVLKDKMKKLNNDLNPTILSSD